MHALMECLCKLGPFEKSRTSTKDFKHSWIFWKDQHIHIERDIRNPAECVQGRSIGKCWSISISDEFDDKSEWEQYICMSACYVALLHEA